MKKIVLGLLAHVDAGKTTLSESILYTTGNIRKMGRVDNRDAFLDTYELERARGITIFSKQAVVKMKEAEFTLLDTPGHVDFSAEMERTLQVLDYAVLVVSGSDGVQGHTLTLWNLLTKYRVPVFLFINKMDQPGTDKQAIMKELKNKLEGNCVDFSEQHEKLQEDIAVCEEMLLQEYMEEGVISDESIKEQIARRKIFPCFFGSALKLQGIEELLEGLVKYTLKPAYKEEFAARVYKIGRDSQGERITYLKITGGMLRNKMPVTDQENLWEEKVNQIRVYSGDKYDSVPEVAAGTICCVLGLTKTEPGMGLGAEKGHWFPVLEPVLAYQMLFPDSFDASQVLKKVREIEEEIPELHISWEEQQKEIRVQIMGEVQIDLLRTMMKERFDIPVSFGVGKILYRETIGDVVEGVGHFEPLRHYAEVHLLLEPLERGAGLVFATDCSEEVLARNWQRLILTHLEEKEHLGVLTGSPITDMKITVVSGRAHQKHTEGGDFRQATYRAVRQGLMQAESILLEPYYRFTLELPQSMVGRGMSDMEKKYGSCTLVHSEDGVCTLKGEVPVSTMGDYQSEVIAYTKGLGRLSCEVVGYGKCHNQQEVVEELSYQPEADLCNPTGSVFCSHGSGYLVEWDQVKDFMHLESIFSSRKLDCGEERKEENQRTAYQEEQWIDTDEIDSILARTFYSNRKDEEKSRYFKKTKKQNIGPVFRSYENREKREEYLLVDGYNVIFSWEELSELAKTSIDAARGKLMDILCNYQGMKKCQLILVFDAYRVENHQTEILDYHNIHVVYTKEAETADQYIEKFAHDNHAKYKITVATSDGLEQIIIRGQGCLLVSARELKLEVESIMKELQEAYIEPVANQKHRLTDLLSASGQEQLEQLKGQPIK